MFMALTGSRRTATCEIRREHVNEAGDVIHFPKPKGGTDRAFDLPLSGVLQDLVRWRLDENVILFRKSPWLFPSATSKCGHVVEVKERSLGELTGHALRHLYSSLAIESGVPIEALKFLLNHKIPSNDVTMGYLNPGLTYLREQQEKASGFIIGRLGLKYHAETCRLSVSGGV